MKILSITSSSAICGIAILEDEQVIKEVNLNNGLTHSESLLPLVSQVLEETKLQLIDIDLLAIDIGPRFIYWNTYWDCYCKSFCR